MHWKTTLALLVLTAGAGAWLWKGDEWAVQWGLRPPAVSTASTSPTVAVLDGSLAPGKVARIEMPSTDPTEPFTLERVGDAVGWKLPGNWPLRKAEVDELVGLLTHLRTRFEPIPLAADADLSPFGLAPRQGPLAVQVSADGQTHALRFGEPPAADGAGPFTRPAYVRVDDLPEVLRLGPDVMPVLRRPLDEYRRRQLFPDAVRLKLTGGGRPTDPFGAAAGAATVETLGDAVAGVAVSGPGTAATIFGAKVNLPDGSFALTRTAPTPAAVVREKGGDPAVSPARLAETWELSKPGRDRPDPDKLRALLAAVTDLWAEEFARPAGPTGLDKPERSITVTARDGTATTLLIGAVSSVKAREEAVPSPPRGMPPMGPTTRTVREEYRYAKLADNPATFVLRADKFADLFVKSTELKDARLARFDAADAQGVVVAVPGQPETRLTRKKGNPTAEAESDKQDRWFLARNPEPVLADETKVTELLNQLSGLEARGPRATPLIADPKAAYGIDPAGGTRVTVLTRERRPDDQPQGPEHTFTFAVGKPDAAEKKLPIQVAGWPRVNLVDNADDKVSKLLERPAVAYRGRRLFDTAEAKLTRVEATAVGAEPFALQRADGKGPWKLSRPVAVEADAAKASQLTDDLAQLNAVDYLSDSPKPEDLTKFGLDKPKFTVALSFAGDGGPRERKLEIGNGPEGKPESYARLDGGSVFTVGKGIADSLKAGAIALLPLQIWSVPEDKFTGFDIRRTAATGVEEYKLAADGARWKVVGPFEAPVPADAAKAFLAALATLKAERFEAMTAADPAAFGFDKPTVRVAASYKEPKPPGVEGEQPATRTLVVGKPTADGAARFARVEGGPNPAVFAVPAALVAEMDRPALDRLDRTLLSLPPGTLSKLQIAGPKPEDALALAKDDKGPWKAEGASFAVDGPTAARLVGSLSRLAAERLAGYGPGVKWAEYGLDKPEWTVTATAGGTAHVVQLGRVEPSGDRYARVDGGPALALLFAPEAANLARGKLEFVDRTLLTFDPSTLAGFARKKGAEELEIEPGTTQGWNLVKPAKHKGDQALMDELSESLGRLRAVRVASYGPKDGLKAFGLDAPAAVVTVKVGDKAVSKVLRIGNPVEAGKPDGDRFAAVDGAGPDATVGVLSAALCKRLLADPIGFRDRTVAKFVDADKLTLERGDRKATFAKVDGTWKLTEPIAADAEQADLNEFVNALATLRAAELVADKPADLKPYGLDKPEARWKAFDKGNEVLSLAIGKADAEGRAFAKADKGDAVALLDAPSTARMLAEYRKRKAWEGVDAAQVESAVVSGADRTFQFRKEGATWIDPAHPAETVSPAAVNDLLEALAGLKAVRYASDTAGDPKLYGLEKPERVIVLTQKGGTTKALEIGREEGGSSGKRVYARVRESGRTDVFVIGETDSAKLTRDRAGFIEKKK